tara:strand:- start:1365 stop:1721 length:357 start_codon:yes stop_codon:yes gene_type:complete
MRLISTTPIFALSAAACLFGGVFMAAGEEYGESFYKNHPKGVTAPSNLRVPVVQGGVRHVQGSIIDSNSETRRIAVQDHRDQVYWFTVPANQNFSSVVSHDRVFVKFAGFTAVDITAG